jgi:hypothetical protein
MSNLGNTLWMALAAMIGLFGLFLASRAEDLGFHIFGMSLAAFAVIYIFTLIKRAYDRS